MAARAFRLQPLASAGGAPAPGVEGVPGVKARAHPEAVALGLPATPWTANPGTVAARRAFLRRWVEAHIDALSAALVPRFDADGESVQRSYSKSYEGIAEDYRRSIELLESLKPDVFLAAHGGFFGLRDKAERMRKGETPNPFVESERYRSWLKRGKAAIEEQLARDRSTQ